MDVNKNGEISHWFVDMRGPPVLRAPCPVTLMLMSVSEARDLPDDGQPAISNRHSLLPAGHARQPHRHGRAMVPHLFGSKTDLRGRLQAETVTRLKKILYRMLPQTRGTQLDQAWCGVLGVPRYWTTMAGLDERTRIAWAGGYVGADIGGSSARSTDRANQPAAGQPAPKEMGARAIPVAGSSRHVLALPFGRQSRGGKRWIEDITVGHVGKPYHWPLRTLRTSS